MRNIEWFAWGFGSWLWPFAIVLAIGLVVILTVALIARDPARQVNPFRAKR